MQRRVICLKMRFVSRRPRCRVKQRRRARFPRRNVIRTHLGRGTAKTRIVIRDATVRRRPRPSQFSFRFEGRCVSREARNVLKN